MSKNPDPPDRVGDLSPERRAVLIRMLRDRSARREETASIPRRPAGVPAPLSFAQHRLWFLDRLAPGASTYNMARAVRLRGRLDRQALERALGEIVRRHEILRTTFAETPEGPVQIVASCPAMSVPVVECGTVPADRQTQEIRRRAAEEARRPFDLARGPLVRVVLLRLSDEDHVIVLVMHHIVGDGWSIGLFDRELALLYGAFSCGRPSPLPDLTLQYADFAHWQRLWLQGREPQRLLELGRRQLLGARFVLGLPLDRPRPAAPTYGGARLEFVVPADRTRRLEELARREGATPFMVLLATFQALLGRLTGQDDLCVGTPVAGRTRLETEPLIGVFVNSLVLRADLSSDPTFVELLGRVRSTALDALARQDLPFEKFVEVLRPDRHPSVHPLFQAMFVLQDGVQDAPGLPGLQAESVDFEMGSTPFDLTLIVSKRDGALEAVMEYSTDLFDRPSIERMAGHFETLLEVFLADPSRRPSEIPLVGLTETLREAQDARRDTVAVAGPAPHAPPRGSTERALARIWADLLGRERVGIHDNFFEAGGHSLLALQLVSRVREILHVEIPVRRVFERPTIAGLAADIDGPVAARSREDGIERVLGRAPSALSSAQRRLWFIDQMQPGTPAYNIPLALRLRGRLDEDALERSLATIIGRHEALRTVFPVVDGEPLQCVLPPRPPGTRPLDLAGLPPGARETEALRLAKEEAGAPFDLARGPLSRARLLRLDGEDHVLILTLHHIVSDGWSLGVLLRELRTLYEGFVAGQPAPLPDLAIQYADYAAWELARLQGERMQADVAYWKRRLSASPGHLDLPFDRPRPVVASFRGAFRPFRLPEELSAAIKGLALREGTTVFAVLLAAFQTLLFRYSGQDDLCVGTPVAGRPRLETEDLIGCFVNTLVLRGDLSGDPTFQEVVRRARESVLEAQTHQDLPFERLVDLLALPRDPARQPLFQVALVMQNLPIPEPGLAGLSVETLDIDTGTAKFDLTMQVDDTGADLAGSVEYSTDLFDAATIDRLLGHFRTLLEAAAADPDRRIAELPLLQPDERRELVAVSGGVCPDTAGALCLHEIFERQARLAPAATALTFGDQTLRYGELNARAESIARVLRRRGVGPDSMVGVWLDRSPEMIVAILGILKAGGAYVPLDPAYPRDRLRFILEDTKARVILTSARLLEALSRTAAGSGAESICLEDLGGGPDREGTAAIESGVRPDHAAYVIYTSGSTGRPKGVVVTHRNVVRLFEATRTRFDFGPADVWTLFHSCAFDFSVWEMWGALLHGGRLVIVPYLVSRTPEAFLDLLRRERVTVLNQTPSAFLPLMRAERSAGPDRDPALRVVIFGGEALDPAALRPWFERHGGESPALFNMYGITETTVHVSCRRLRADDAHRRASPIGGPIRDLRLYVLDRDMEPAPYGAVGEIHVGGPGLARGYLNRPDLTAEQFIADPFSAGEGSGSRLYRTGDLARRRVGGEVEYLGRADEQVKIRGFRIEPGEIEAELARCPGVRQAVVLARAQASGEKRLVAYVVPETGALRTLDIVRGFLMERLPDYMVPSTFMFLEALPATPSGKIDRRALPAPERARPDLAEGYVAPRTSLEETIADIWAEVLGLETIGIDDNFFALGGDSIRCIQVRAKAGEIGIDITLQQMFAHQTIRGLAAELTRALPADAPRGRPGAFDLVSPEDRARLPSDLEDAYPLSRLQQGFVFHSEFSPDYIIYVSSIEVGAPFLSDRLRAALARLVERQPILRTSFDLTGFSEPLQLVHRAADVPIGVFDLTRLSPPEQDAALGSWVEEEMRVRFDWTRHPLMRLHVHLLGEARFQLTVSEPFFDGWSVATFMTDLLEAYSALLRGENPPPEPPLRSTYREFVALEREALLSEACRDFWTGKVTDATASRIARLETAPRDERALPVCRVEVPITPETSGALQRLAWSAGVPLKSVLLAAHLKVVGLRTGRGDVVTGLIANGRPEEQDGEKILGIFLNTLPLRMRLPGGTWTDLARHAFESEREMLPYRRFPMTELQRMTGGQFLSDTAFNYTSFHVYRRLERKGGLDLWGGYGFEQTYFALTAQFNLDEFTSQVYLALDYRSAELSRREVEEIAAHYARVLATMADDPEGRHDRFEAVTGPERRRVLSGWNDTRRDYPPDLCVHDLFEAQAGRVPGAVAVVDGARTLTYRELSRSSSQVACRLRALGAGPEELVAVCLPRSLDLVIALLGILKAGSAYVPLDPAYPGERLAFMLSDTRAAVLVTREDLLGIFPPHPARVLCLDRDHGALERGPSDPPRSGVLPGNLAYVIYTSGSTGRPKGAAIEHGSTVSLLHWARDAFGDEDLSGVLASSSICFDSSVLEIFAPLSWGGTVILAENALQLQTLEARGRVRLVNTVPSAMAELVRSGALPASVRTVSLAGEALSRSLVQRVYAQGTIERVINLYGLSEATVYTTMARPARGATDATPIGRPVSNARVYLLGEDLDPVSPGVPGEICVGGTGPGRGYVNRPDLTAERFIPDPFGDVPGARLYRTGDLGRFRPDGTIDFLGRIDQQVKIRGFRIEPGEIESVLGSHPAIGETVVQVREEKDGDRRLVAYVVPKPGPASLSLRELRRYLAARLPEYMVPATFVVLAALPRTPNGKLDRKSLPAPAPSRLAGDEAPIVPVTPEEKKLARLWGQVLKIDRVGLNDNFFEAGGHSLLATQLISRVREAFKIDLPLRALFDAPTVAGLLRAIENARAVSGEHAVQELRTAPRGGDLPLSFAQQRLWFLDRLEPGCAFYNIPAALRLLGALDAEALRRSLSEIVRRHEALRTTFTERLGEPVQDIAPAHDLDLPLVDLGHVPAGGREREVLRLARDEARAPFDLSNGPLLRVGLVRLAGDDHVLFLTTHHAVSDGWSMQVFLRELAHLYGAFREGRPSPLAEPLAQYADFALWQRQWLQGDVLRGQLEYWKERLAGAPLVLDLPADRPRPPVQTYHGARHSFAMPRDLGVELEEFGRREGVTLFMTLLAAFQSLLYRYTGQEGILVGTPIAGRSRVETEGMIGFFVNTLVLRGDLSGDPSFRTLLSRTRDSALGSYAHQDLPFEKLVEALQPERDLGRAPLFQVMFALQPPPDDGPELPGLEMQYMEIDTGTSQFDLTLSITDDGQGLAGSFEYSTDLFDEPRIARMAGHLEALLRAALADPERRVSSLPILSPAERRTVLAEWSGAGGERARPEDPAVLDRIEAQAARTPEAPAVVSENHHLAYGDLDRRATRLARHLKSLGVGAEVPVAICLERSVDLVVGILGVLKAGGAYVPLDPAYPRERLDFILRDTRAPILLTREGLLSSLQLRPPCAVCLDSAADAAAIARAGDSPLDRRPGPDDLAYVIYTSGSTGLPKGVLVTHRNLARSTAARLAVYREPIGGFLLLPSFAFDSSVAGIFWSLSAGGTLVLPPENVHEEPQGLLDLIRRQGVSHWLSVPSLYAYALAQARPGDLASLRTVIVAGEACPPELVMKHRDLLPQARLFNEYGPTEATVWCAAHDCGAPAGGAREEDRSVPIGRPIPGARLHVLDRIMEPAPIGVAGELYVGGAGVARGYLGRPELTAEAFVPDPWSGERSARLYRTGDLGRYLPDGRLEFLGRVDHQVKVRGYRIEPGEIETVLARHISIHESAVVVQEASPGDRRLVAFVVPETGEVVLPGDLRSFLKQKLPAYMVPSSIVALDTLPTTANGKVDRRALQTMRVEGAGRGAARQTARPAAPRDEIERRLIAVWEGVLNVRPIGVDESFFDLGGHSLMTVRLMARVESEFGTRLPLSILFRGGTIASLADALRRGAAPDVRPPLVRLSGDSSATKPPFYCVHPIGGTVLCYGALARRLGTDRPFCALEAPGLHGAGAPDSSVETLAARYVEALRGHQPRGPYALGGWSFGGVVAYEMACRLARLGETVALLALIDSRAPGSLPASATPVEGATLVAMLARELGVASGGPDSLTGTGDRGPLETDSSVERVLERAKARGLLPSDIGLAEVRCLLEVLRSNLRALRRYLPASYPGRVTLFRAALGTAPRPDATYGWRSLATGGVEVHEVPGDHYSIVREPHVRVLSDLLRARLDDAARRTDSITREVAPTPGERRAKRRAGSPADAAASESS